MKLQHLSNRKIFVISLLSFTSGLAFLGSSNIVQADTSDTTVAQTDSNTNSNADPSNVSSDNGSVTAESGNSTVTSDSDSTESVSQDNKTASTDETNSNQTDQSDSGQDTVENQIPVQASVSTTQAVAQNNQTTDDTDTSDTSLNIPADTASDHQGKLSGDNGSEWYLDNNGTLYIGAGTVSNPTFDDTSDETQNNSVWNNYKYADDITNVVFEDGAVAGASLSNYFRNMSKLVNVDVSKLDVSNTKYFSYMFFNTGSLDSLDISKWKLATGANFSSFVSGSGIKHLDLSGLTFTNANLNNAFGMDENLEDIDLTNFSATGVTDANFLFHDDSSLKSLDLTGFAIPSGVNTIDMLSGLTSLTSLKVNSDTVLSGTDLGASTGYKSWSDGTNTYSPADLMAVYGDGTSTDPDSRTSTTWTPAESTKVDYTINYYGNGSLVGSVSGTGVEGQRIALTPNYPGYDTFIVNTPYIDLTTDNSVQTFNFNLNPHETYPVTVTESDGSKLLNSQLIQRVYNDDENNQTKIQNVKDNLVADRTLDLDDTTIEFTFNDIKFSGKLSDTALEDFTIGQLFNLIINGQPDDFPADTTREQLIDDSLTLADINLSSVTLGLVYQPVSSDNDSSSSGSGSSSSMVLKNQNIATTTKTVKLYGADGKLVTNRALDINTAWKSDAEYNLNGVKYYRVSTDEYVKASDVYVYTDNVATVKVYDDQKGDLVDYLGADLDRKLGAGSEWKTDRIAHINGQEYYRVSTDEFLAVGEGVSLAD